MKKIDQFSASLMKIKKIVMMQTLLLYHHAYKLIIPQIKISII